jgi:hypothetical protein
MVIIILYSCQKKNIYENIIEYNKIQLLESDYKIINYSEELFYEDFITYDMQIEIVNIEKINQLKDNINPEIYLEYNNKIILIKKIYAYVSAIWEYSFPYTEENDRIMFFENNSIKIMGYIKNK